MGINEIKYETEKSNNEELKLNGNEWYKFYDPNQYKELQVSTSDKLILSKGHWFKSLLSIDPGLSLK